eukprot:gene2072-2261_t
MACSDASEPEKTVPRSFLWAFGIAAFSAMLLIITVGCNAPGVAYMANLKTNALVYGYAKGLHIDPRVARSVNIKVTLFGYFCRVRHSQKFSLQEQEVMFQAYVINDAMSVAMSANLSRRTKKRHNVHTTTSLNTPTASPSPSKSHMLKESKALLSRVSACLPRMPRLQTGWYSVERLRRAGNLSTDNLKREKVVYPDEYSSAVKGETRLFQLQGGKGEEEATTPDLGKNSLFSLSLEVVECGVRKHPASEYDNKGQYNGSTKYRIAPDYVTTEQFPSSMKNIFSDEGIVVESSGKASVDDA